MEGEHYGEWCRLQLGERLKHYAFDLDASEGLSSLDELSEIGIDELHHYDTTGCEVK